MRLITFLLILVTSVSFSLTIEKGEFNISAGTGYSLPSKKNHQGFENNSRFAYSLGIMTEVPFSDLITVSTGIMVVNDGFNFAREQSNQYFDYNRNFESNYNIFNIQIPLKVSYFYFNTNKIKTYFSGGIFYNYLINENIKQSNQISLFSKKAIENINYSITSPAELENYFFGLLFTAGAQFSKIRTEVFFRSSWDPFYYFLHKPAENDISVSFIGLNVAYRIVI